MVDEKETNAPAEEKSWWEKAVDKAKDFGNNIVDGVKDAHEFMTENVYKPVGEKVADAHEYMTENVYKPVGGKVKEGWDKTVEVAKDTHEFMDKNVYQPVASTLEKTLRERSLPETAPDSGHEEDIAKVERPSFIKYPGKEY